MTSRDPIFATLDALIAEGPPDWPDEAEDRANRVIMYLTPKTNSGILNSWQAKHTASG